MTPPEQFIDTFIHEHVKNLTGEELDGKTKESFPSTTHYNKSESSSIMRNRQENSSYTTSFTSSESSPFIQMSPTLFPSSGLATLNYENQTSLVPESPFHSDQKYLTFSGSSSMSPNMSYSSESLRSCTNELPKLLNNLFWALLWQMQGKTL